MPRLGIYIQVPFCQTRCTYCNFHTGVVSSDRFAPYADAVCREIRGYQALYEAAGIRPQTQADAADTVYVGGGTPSLLDPTLLSRMLDAVRGSLTTDLREVTLEADPETVTEARAAAWAG